MERDNDLKRGIRIVIIFCIFVLFPLLWIEYMFLLSDTVMSFGALDKILLSIIVIKTILLFVLFVVEEIIAFKCKLRESYYLLFIGITSLIVWVETYKGTNFNIGDVMLNSYCSFQLFAFILISFLITVFQLRGVVLIFKGRFWG